MDEGPCTITSRGELRSWLEAHHSDAKECFVRCRKGAPEEGTLSYLDVVEEALCFGWIDSTTYPDTDGFRIQRISPRRPGSHWSERNKERALRAERLGIMTDAGRSALPDMTTDPDVLFPSLMERIRADPEFADALGRLPPLYVRIKLDGIANYGSSFERFRESAIKGKVMGEWDDYGRLLSPDSDY
ncbi:MAG: thymidylate synthase [Thermoplasmata archaeon]|nr:thymidylate synthase [Thermoplasmata archaeon]